MNLGFTGKDFFRYAVLPGFKPRFAALFLSGFSYVPYFIALVYQSVRLLPNTHPYLNPDNIGRFGIRAVIAEAANNLVMKRENIDQILLFFTILLGLTILFVQLILLCLTLFTQPALAVSLRDLLTDVFGTSGVSATNLFLTPEATRQHDLAGMMMDLVFGVPGMFDSCVAMAGGCQNLNAENVVGVDGNWYLAHLGFPFPVHQGLHKMFAMYSTGLLVVGAFIASYFMVAVVAETAQTGTPFGKRFNKVWAPLRIVVAFGLLIPIGVGLNGSQYMVLYAAKYGSGFATNGWNLFNNTLVENYLGQTRQLVSQPNIPEVSGLLQFLYVARTCRELEALKPTGDRAVEGYLIGDPLSTTNAMPIIGTSYDEMVEFADGAKQITIRFGVRPDEVDEDNYSGPYAKYKGYTEPTCGELTMTLKDPRLPGSDNPPEEGTEVMQRYYWFVIKELWHDILAGNTSFVAGYLDGNDLGSYTENFPRNVSRYATQWDPAPNIPLPDADYKKALQTFYSYDLQAAMLDPSATSLDGILNSTKGALKESEESGAWAVSESLKQKGWAGAGIWYNKVAELNGAVTGSVLNVPIPTRYPMVMEFVSAKKRQQDQNVTIGTRFEPVLANGEDIGFQYPEGHQMATAMWTAYSYWQADAGATTTYTAPTGNVVIDAINAIFGTEGLMSIRRNKDVHPLAQLVGVGKSLMESSINNLVIASGGAGFSAIFGGISKSSRAVMTTLVGFLVTVAMVGLTAGFVLFYVVPFMPFIYFFFAVSGWVKGIFEAMVGAPLWALAHIRIDGDGLPGKAAESGYYLIFEVFLRPILIVFGLLASISIFSALVLILNETWDLVLSNLSGFDIRAEVEGADAFSGATFEPSIGFMRGALDTFMFTIIYTIIIYLMGMSSFKLIDLIPNNILRWMGQNISTFNDSRDDPAQGLVGTATIGAQQTLSAVGGGTKGALQGIAGGGLTGGGPKKG